MGGKQSTSYEYDDVMENYDALHKIRQEVFSENYTREQWQKILKDFVSLTPIRECVSILYHSIIITIGTESSI